MRISDWSSDVCSSDLAVEHKTALRLHRPSRQNRHVRGDAGIDLQLRQEPVQRDALNLCANAYAHRAPLVMDAHGDDGALEPGIVDTGHRKQPLAGEIGGVGHSRPEEHTSELQSLMRSSYAVFCLTTTKTTSHVKNQISHTQT